VSFSVSNFGSSVFSRCAPTLSLPLALSLACQDRDGRDGITSATNDIGIITLPDGTHLAVAVFVSDSSADEATRESVIAQIAKAAWDSAQSLGE
jgi:beta-lactamase class A